MNEPHGGRPNSRSSRNAIPIEIKVAAISKIQSGRRPDTVSQEMEVPVGLINKWWLQREDIRTQFERYSKVQDYQERLFQKSLEQNGCDKDCDEKEISSDVGKKKDPNYEEKVSIVKGGSSGKGKKKKKGESPFKSRKRIELPTKSKDENNSKEREDPPPIKSMPKASQRRASNTKESKTQAPARRTSSSTRELVANLFPSGISPPKNKNKTRVSDEEVKSAKRVRVSSPGAVPRITNQRRRSSASDRGVSPPLSSVTSSLTPGDVSSELSKIKDEISSPIKDHSPSSLQIPISNKLPIPNTTVIPNNKHMDHTVNSILSKQGEEIPLNAPLSSTAPSTLPNQSPFNPDRRPSQESVTNFQNDIMKELNISLELTSDQQKMTVANTSAPQVDLPPAGVPPPPAAVHSVPVPLTSHTISIKKEITAESAVSQDQNLNLFPKSSSVIPSSGETQSYPLVPTAIESDPKQYYTPYLVPASSASMDDIAEPEPAVNQVNSSRINIKKEMNQEYIEETPSAPLAIGHEAEVANKYYSSIGASAPVSFDPAVSHQTSSAVNVKRERISPEPETSSAPQDASLYSRYGLSAGHSTPGQGPQTQINSAPAQPVVGQPPSPQVRPVMRGRGQVRPAMRGRGGQQPIIRGVRPPVARVASPIVRGASPNMRGQPNVRGVRPVLRGVRPIARGQMRPGMRPQGGQPRLLRPPGVRPGQPQPVRGVRPVRGGPGPRPAAPRPAAPRPAAPIPSSLQRIGGLSITRQAPVELPSNLRLPSGISLSHPRGIQNQPPGSRQAQHQAPVQRRSYEPPVQRQSNEAPKKKVTLELSQKQIDALKSLGML